MASLSGSSFESLPQTRAQFKHADPDRRRPSAAPTKTVDGEEQAVLPFRSAYC